jgi:RecA-family ATPase
MNLYGIPKAGKSFAAMQLAHAISNEKVSEWLGLEVAQHCPVAYFQLDTPRTIWMERIETFEKELGYSFDNVYFADLNLIPRFPFNILQDNDKQAFQMGLSQLRPQPHVVIVDTLREAHNSDEDNATVMRNVISNIVFATRPAATIFISHARKASVLTDDDDVINDTRGSSYVSGRMDAIIKQTYNRLLIKSRSLVNEEIKIKQQQNPDAPDYRFGEIVRIPGTKELTVLGKACKLGGTPRDRIAYVQKELQLSEQQATMRLEAWITTQGA